MCFLDLQPTDVIRLFLPFFLEIVVAEVVQRRVDAGDRLLQLRRDDDRHLLAADLAVQDGVGRAGEQEQDLVLADVRDDLERQRAGAAANGFRTARAAPVPALAFEHLLGFAISASSSIVH